MEYSSGGSPKEGLYGIPAKSLLTKVNSINIYDEEGRCQENAWNGDRNSLMIFPSGNADLYAAPEPRVTTWYPSITETIPPTHSDLRNEFGKLENLMWRQQKARSAPTATLPAANDR